MKRRRITAVGLVVLGGVLMFFAPVEAPWLGWVLLGTGAVVEVLGIALEHKKGAGPL